MMAYVDGNGNITSIPQELGTRNKVIAENILIGTPKQENIEVEIMKTGIVAFFNESKGLGFIKDLQTHESIFVHINATSEQIKENDKVTN